MSSKYPTVTNPLKGADAFRTIGEVSSQSQAAILLQLGRQLRTDDQALIARARAVRASQRVMTLGLEADDEFPVPRLNLSAPVRRTATAAAAQGALSDRFGYTGKKSYDVWEKTYADCAENLYQQPDTANTTQLLELCLNHPMDLVKISAAASYHAIAKDRDRLTAILVKGVRSQDEMESGVAATALARVDPKNAALARFAPKGGKKRGKPAHTLTVIHGTWAANGTWFRPGGDFFDFIKPSRPDLYDGPDIYTWSGGYSDKARSDGANGLKKWVDDKGAAGLDIMGHSHGANVILLASKRGLKMSKVVLLSCPVHVDKYFPDFTKVSKPVFSVRVKLDLVIAADFGGQKFKDPNIKEIVLPLWFDHFASHSPQVWRDNNVGAQVGIP